MLETSTTVARQYIGAVSTFEALEEAQVKAAQVRGGICWHAEPVSVLPLFVSCRPIDQLANQAC